MGTKKIDTLLQRAVSEGTVPGAVGLAANRKGIIYQGAFGCRDMDKDLPMTMDSVFWIASMSKAITTTAAMQLVEKGLLHLDEPIYSLLPELGSVDILEGFNADGQPQWRKPGTAVTLRHLLTHTAGFAYEFFNQDILNYMSQNQMPSVIACMNISLRTPLVHEPGQRWEYGTSVDWVGKAIEAVSGQSLSDYFKDQLFPLLDMNDTAFTLSAEMYSRLAMIHQREASGSLTRTGFLMPHEPEFFMGGGGLYSTAGDYLKFLMMILNGGIYNEVRILQPETIKEMGRNQIGDVNVLPLKTTMPSISQDAEFFPGIIKKWGLGFMLITEDAPTGRSAGSMSWVGLANSFFWIDPVKEVAGILLTQVFPFADEQVMDLFSQFETLIYEQL